MPGWKPWSKPFSAPDFKLLLERAVLCSDCPEGDPGIFYAATAATQGLKTLLNAVAERVQGKGIGVILVQSSRGWGKTHALAAVAHAVKSSGRAAASAPEPLRRPIDTLSRARSVVAVFDGSSTGYRDIIRDYGLYSAWSLIIQRLVEPAGARLEIDLRGPPPGASMLSSLIISLEKKGRKPVFLIDDADRYLEGLEGSTRGGSTEELPRMRREAQHFLAFLSALAESVSTSRFSLLVVSVTRGSPAADRVAEALGDALIVSDPVEPEELGVVLKARLVRAVEPGAAAEALREYTSIYRRLGLDTEELLDSYPFHPLFLAALRSLVSGSPSHRGVSSALAIAWRALARSLERGNGVDYVLPGDLNAVDPGDLDVMLPRGSGGLEGLRVAAERDAEAVVSVEERLATKGLQGVAPGIYAHLLLWSASGKPLSGPAAVAGVVSPFRGVSVEDALEALDLLEEEAVHIHTLTLGGVKHYIIRSKVNLDSLARREARRLISERREEALSLLRELTLKLLGRVDSPLEVVMWPSEPPQGGWPVKLVILGPGGPRASEVLEAAFPRVNTLAILEPDRDRLNEALEAAALAESLRRLTGEGVISGEDAEEAQKLATVFENRAREALALAYSRILYPTPGGLGEAQLGVERILSSGLWAAARDALVRAGKLVHERLDPTLLEEVLSPRGSATLEELVEELARNPRMPLILKPWEAVEAAARRLVSSGRAAVAETVEPCSRDPGPLDPSTVLLSCREAVARGLCNLSQEGVCIPVRSTPEASYGGKPEREAREGGGETGDHGRRGEADKLVAARVPPRELAAFLAKSAGELRIERLSVSMSSSGARGVAVARALLDALSSLGARRVSARVRVEAVLGSARIAVEASGEPGDVAGALRGVWALGDVVAVNAHVSIDGLGINGARLGEALAASPLRLYKTPLLSVEARISPS